MPDLKATSISVREARPEDAAQIGELGTHTFTVTYGHLVPPEDLKAHLDEKYSSQAISQDLSNPQKTTLVATTETDTVVGFALLTRGTTEPCLEHLEALIELQRLYVHPDCHGRGVGKALVQRAEAIARREGCRNVWLGVWEHAMGPKRVYERLGYRFVGEHDFVLGKVVHRDLVMAKEL